MTSKATTKTASPKTSSPKTSRRSSPQQSQENSRKHSPKHSVKYSVKKPSRINRQRRLQKQLQTLILERHSRRCIICHHPEREAIEEEFVHWRAPWKLAQDYKLTDYRTDYRTVYRHARAAGLLLQRRERLHSALDAFVESVDDVTFTGDTILRAMRAYSCIDSHGRWTEIPTQVQFSTSNDAHPPQPSPRGTHVASDVIDIDPDPDEVPGDDAEEDADNAPEERVTALDVLNVIRKYSNQAPQSDATTCAKSPAQALNVTEDEYDELEDDDSYADEEPEDDAEEDAENELEEVVTSFSTSSNSKSMSRSDTTACAASPAQAVNVSDDEDDPENDPDDNGPKNKPEADRLEETTACAAPPAQSVVPLSSNHRGRNGTATACAASPAQALPRDVVRGQNPNDRSLSDRTDCAALPRPSRGAPAQPAAPPKPKPDADGLIWHPHPGYPNQEMSEPDAQGRVRYKIHMTTAAAQLPSRETDAQRAAKLIYGSVIKKYGNP